METTANNEAAVSRETANVVRVAGDLVVASSFAVSAEVIPPLFEVHEGIVGLSGVVSGAAGLFNSWNAPSK